MAGAVTNRVIDVVDPNIVLDEVDIDRILARIDPDDLLARVDLNALVDRLDLNAVLDRVDPNALLDRVDANALLDRVDPNMLLARVDPNALLDRVNPNALLDQVDINRLMARVDVDALLAQADIEDLVRRSGVPEIVASSTTHMLGSLIDVVRRQLAGLDTIVHRTIDRLLRREPDVERLGPPELRPATIDDAASGRVAVTGRYAGPFSRLLAAGIDLVIASVVFTLSVAGLNILTSTFFDAQISSDRAGFWGVLSWSVWLFLYCWASFTIAGRTPGMALVGIRVVNTQGHPLGPWAALVRTLVLPLSAMVFGLGLLMALPHPQHRTLHDLAAHTVVVYDWGDRPAELPGPLSAYVSRHAEV
ncbi:RDD family protein [Nocardioides insulae]|uniref:RDD family protein n=1 Tax=Nocardioides insulae TaxID=394734 RepID=UPI0004145BA8|nr:RDD family protein [Nocardioides insulae]